MKKQSFVTGWSVNEQPPTYDALVDPNASYYFFNPSVKQHLRQLKKALKFENKSPSRRHLETLLSRKIKEGNDQSQKAEVYERDVLGLASISKKSINSFHSKRRQIVSMHSQELAEDKLPGILTRSTNQVQTVQPPVKAVEPPIKKGSGSISQQRITSNKLAQELHLKKRERFLQYIELKKKALLASKIIEGPQDLTS